MAEFLGILAVAPTPRGRQGEIALGVALDLVDFLSRSGVQGIVLFDAAGEYTALGADERSRLLYLAVKRSRVPVWAGVGAPRLDAALVLAREACDAGAAALLVPPPHFYRYGQEDLREFFLRFAGEAETNLPLWLANLPRFASELSPETARELLAGGGFAGIEDASGDLAAIERLRPFPVLTGRDEIFGQALCAGAAGAVSGAACAVPELITALAGALAAGATARAAQLDGALREFTSWMDRFPEPVLLKAALGLRGMDMGPPAVPLGPSALRAMDEFREWFPGWVKAVRRAA
jgi:dihydrodipicolinate synthase/N-acetylneuraminate lyase